MILLLQGPSSLFFDRLGRALLARGAKILRINICPGDWLYWRMADALCYRGRLANWPVFVRGVLETHGVTDLVLLGDSRRWHTAAIVEARACGIRVHVVELGLIRPDWLTVEPEGMASFSHFPHDPDGVRALAAGETPSLVREFQSSFFIYATLDVVWNLANVFLGPFFYPHYRTHAIDHPLVEYAGWIWKGVKAPFLAGSRRRQLAAALVWHGPTFLMPLQLRTDFQIRVHAPQKDLRITVWLIIASFARHAPKDAQLVFKVHPLDNGWTPWGRIIREAAIQAGVAARCMFIVGGDLNAMLNRAAGVVTVNSTVGISALRAGVPTIALGNAIYDMPGLTFQGRLDDFWSDDAKPDASLVEDFLKALAATTQVRGGFDGTGTLPGAAAVAERILEEKSRLPAPAVEPPRPPKFRRSESGDPISEVR